MTGRQGVINLPPDGVVLPFEVERDHTDDEWKRIRRVLRVRASSQGWVVQPSSRYAGLIHVGSTAFYIAPPVPLVTFLGMVLLAEGLDQITDDERVAAIESHIRPPTIMQILAALLVLETERLAAGHIAQGYIQRRDRLSVIRGRPVFSPERPRPPDGHIRCDYWIQSTDIPANQVLVAGLTAASQWLVEGSWARRCRTQRFVWSGLAEFKYPTPALVSTAHRSLNRLTSHYGSALRLAEALFLGWDPLAVLVTREEALPAPVFDMASLFERLVERLTGILAATHGLQVEPQITHGGAIRDARGDVYRRIRPDLLVNRSGRPVAVLDAKFKPRYAAGGPSIGTRNRVTREDLFQLFFYAERLKPSDAQEPLPAIIAAPLLPGQVPPSLDRRRIRWSESGRRAQIQLQVIPLDVVEATTAVLTGDPDIARSAAPELEDTLRQTANAIAHS